MPRIIEHVAKTIKLWYCFQDVLRTDVYGTMLHQMCLVKVRLRTVTTWFWKGFSVFSDTGDNTMMEPVLSIERKSRKRSNETSLDFNLCIICQYKTSPHGNSKDVLCHGTPQGITTLGLKARERQKYNDIDFLDFHDRMEELDLEADHPDMKWHRACYSKFTNASNIKCLQKRFEKRIVQHDRDQNPPVIHRTLRHSQNPMSWDKCLFCQNEVQNQRLTNVQTQATSEKIITLSQRDPTMRYRVAGISDLISSEGKYHLKCYAEFIRRHSHSRQNVASDVCFDTVMKELKDGLQQGNVYSIDTIWMRYCDLLSNIEEEPGTYHSRNFRDRILRYLPAQVESVCPLNPKEPLLLFPSFSSGLAIASLQSVTKQQTEEEIVPNPVPFDDKIDPESEILSWLYRVALKIRGDISTSPGHDFIGGFDTGHIEKVVPPSLYLLLKLLCTDFGETLDDTCDTKIKMKLLSIAQDIVFVASKGRKKTPKHIALGVTVHQSTRSKKLIQLLHAAGHSINYESVLRVDASLVTSLLEQYEAHGKIFIPSNITHLKLPGYLRFANDNIDINEETLDGKGTFHASQSAIFVKPEVNNPEPPERNVKLIPCKLPKFPEELQELKHAGIGSEQPEPFFWGSITLDLFKPDEQSKVTAQLQDMIWLICRVLNETQQHIPAWSGFNQIMDTQGKDVPVSIIGHLPIINAPAHDYDVIWTVMCRCMDVTKSLGQEFTVLTFDEQLYSKAKMLQWHKKDECKNIILMLGGFHTQMNFAKVIGKHMADAGLKEIWVDMGTFGENTADRILTGKGWNRIIRAHKLTVEALWRVLWPQFMNWSEANGREVNIAITACARNIGIGIDVKNDQLIENNIQEMTSLMQGVLENLTDFDEANSHNPTYCFWRQYMNMVEILLRFTRALRTGNWELYLASIAEMIPWFIYYDHTNYSRWATVFLADAQNIAEMAPAVHKGFLDGGFVVKESSHKFNQLPDDQGLEHINKIGKDAGGLIGITRTDTARDKWSLVYNEKIGIVKATWSMFGLHPDEGDDLD